MAKTLALSQSNLKRLRDVLRNAPLFTLCGVVSISVEVFAWGGILNENHATVEILGQTVRLAYAEVASSTAFSLLALVLAGAAAALQADPRVSQRRRSGWAQLLAVLVLIAPVYYAGNCLGFQRQLANWREYHGSQQEAADRANATDHDVDSVYRIQAAQNLHRGLRPERAEFDWASTGWIALLLGCNMLAVRLGWRVRPETPAEAARRHRAASVAKARHTREMNKRAKAPRANVLQFGRH